MPEEGGRLPPGRPPEARGGPATGAIRARGTPVTCTLFCTSAGPVPPSGTTGRTCTKGATCCAVCTLRAPTE
eukprot:7120251-Alexandrium_andersonii.AAC.1